MAHLCLPQNQAQRVCRKFGRKNLINATITSNAEEEEVHGAEGRLYNPPPPKKKRKNKNTNQTNKTNKQQIKKKNNNWN